jgi:hypothetical protein
MPSTISYIDATRNAFPLPSALVSLFKNSDFNEPFTGDPTTGWASSGGWNWNSLGYAESSNGQYFYQKLAPGTLVIGANYKLQVGISAFSGSEPLKVLADNTNLPAAAATAITAVGEYEFVFNASQSADQFYLYGFSYNGSITCQVKYFRLIRL